MTRSAIVHMIHINYMRLTRDTLLHGIQVTPVVCVLPKTPRHHSAKSLRLDNLLELPLNETGRVPGPEKIVITVPVVLATSHLVGFPVLLGLAPRTEDVGAVADAVIRLTARTAVGIGRAAAVSQSFKSGRFFSSIGESCCVHLPKTILTATVSSGALLCQGETA